MIALRRLMRSAWLVTALTLSVSLGCGKKETEERFGTVPQAVIDGIRQVREECFGLADARPFLPEIDALIASHRDEIATATTDSTDFSLTFGESAITVAYYAFKVTTPDVQYAVADDGLTLSAGSSGVFQYAQTSLDQSGRSTTECTAGPWGYTNVIESGGLFGPGEYALKIRASKDDRWISAVVRQSASRLTVETCQYGICQTVSPKSLDPELGAHALPRTNFVTNEILKFLR